MLIFQRILKLSLTLAFVVGVVMFALAKREQAPIKAEYDRLRAKFGELPNVSPDRFQILSFQSEEPGHLVWRFRPPDNVPIKFNSEISFGGGSCRGGTTSYGAKRTEGLIRFRIDFDNPRMVCFLKYPHGHMTCGSSDAEAAEAYRQHWDELTIETVSSTTPESYSQDEIIDLVRITAPEKFADGTSVRSGENGLCLLVRIGTPTAFDAEKAKAQEQQ
ncbi:hypothetical protein [Blastopirellula retiformator]|uniref:Uncharacterized protein n=1 Tax=Blastopirellula retiformator TaxID=2527970 RepID=A0A5C5V1L6_9BACT|nr:hypothetical protein [Blastopirellula retiformator]TWT31840.1 hypothetical protein Enr8_37650 [Blastopirellula retiformator]